METGTSKITIAPWNQRTGEGSLSYYANKYGTTVDNLMTLNPTIQNKDMISSGGMLNVPTPLIQTTGETKNSNTQNEQKLTGLQNGIEKAGANVMTPVEFPKSEPVTAGDAPGAVKSPYDDALTTLMNNYSVQANLALTSLDMATANMDSATNSMIQSIKQKYAQRVVEMQDINKRLVGSTEKAGMRSGRARYASMIQEGIISDQEMKGVQRIAELHAEEQSLIAQAEQARATFNYKALNDRMVMVDNLYQKKVDTITDLHKNAMDREKMAMERIEFNNKVAVDELNFQQESMNLYGSIAESAVPGFLDEYSKLKTQAQKDAYISRVAVDMNIDENMLKGMVEKESRARQVEDRDYNLSVSQENRLAKSDAEDEKSGDVPLGGGAGQSLTLNDRQRKRLNTEGIEDNHIEVIAQALASGMDIEEAIQKLSGKINITPKAKRRLLRYVDEI